MNIEKRNKTVLLVDDDEDFLLQHKVQLEAAGYDVLTARASGEAMKQLNQAKVDVAVVDLMMEHMDDGFVLCHRLKKTHPDIGVILVTAVAGETGMVFEADTDEERSWVKADVSLAKPVRSEQLQLEIEKLLK